MANHTSFLAWNTLVFFHGNPMDKGALGYNPLGCKESDMTEQLNSVLEL